MTFTDQLSLILSISLLQDSSPPFSFSLLLFQKLLRIFCQFLDLFFHILGDNVDIEEGKQAFDLPELVYNLNLLVDLAESEIIQIDRQ